MPCRDVDGLLAERESLQAQVRQLQTALENAIQVRHALVWVRVNIHITAHVHP